MDCVHVYHGGHLSTSTQQVVSLSTAESEFYGVVRGAASGIQLREAFLQFGFSVRHRVLSDSSAARAMTARTGSGRVKHVEARYLWVQDRVRKKQFSVGSIDTSHNTADLGTKFHSGERLREPMPMMPIVVGEFEPTKLPKKLLGGLFLASQVTQVQGNDDSVVVTQHEEQCAEGFVCLFGFVSGVVAIMLISHMFSGRYAKPPVLHVEVGKQVDLLAYDEEWVQGWYLNMLVHRAQHAHVDNVKRRGSRRSGARLGSARRVLRRFAGEVLVNEHDGS